MGAGNHGQLYDRCTVNRRIFSRCFSLTLLLLFSGFFPHIGHSAPPRVIEDIRYHSDHDSTRVVIECNGPVTHTVGRLQRPSRLFIDLPKTQLAPNWERRAVKVTDGRLLSIRIATNRPGVVRVVLDLHTQQDYDIFTLRQPYRVVIDLQGRPQTSLPPPAVSRRVKPPAAATPQGAQSSAPQPTIVIDPGHGGKDPGAIGPGGIREKTVVLRIAKALHQVIRDRLPNYQVVLTRDRDIFVPLGKRARIANEHQARVFISIHANASTNRQARGIETWYLSFAANERAQQTAARENNMSASQLSELERILLDLRETDRINQSAILAGTTQAELVKRVKDHHKKLPSRGVEGAPFIVLLNTSMPSILVEVAFISNKYDARLLRKQSYQYALAEGIFRGIHKYLQNTVVRAE